MINVAEEKIKYSHQKKVWKPAVREIKKANRFTSLKTICCLLGYSPQAYHKHQNKELTLAIQQGMILQQIDAVRKLQPHLTSMLYYQAGKTFVLINPQHRRGYMKELDFLCLILCYTRDPF